MIKIIKEFPDYKLIVGKRDSLSLYQIVNKEYGVVETETQVLPQALAHIEQLQALLDSVRDESEYHSSLLASVPMHQTPH